MDKKNYKFEIDNYFNITVSTTDIGEFSFYLYKKDKVVKKISYSTKQKQSFNNIQPGTYRVKVFKRSSNKINTLLSDNILIRNVSQTINKYPTFVLDYPNYDLIWISKILEKEFIIKDDLYNNTENSLSLEAIARDNLDSNIKILTCDSQHRYDDRYIYISLSHNSDNPLNELLSRKSVTSLHKLSQMLYQEGFEKGAHYIWIYMRKNSGCSLSYKTKVGNNFNLGLGGINTIIHPNSTIGNNVKIAQQVTIGFSGSSHLSGPIIGDNVYIAPGSMCLGGKIGSNVVVASNSVVLNEVPDNCVVAGSPAKIISTDMKKYENFFK